MIHCDSDFETKVYQLSYLPKHGEELGTGDPPRGIKNKLCQNISFWTTAKKSE